MTADHKENDSLQEKATLSIDALFAKLSNHLRGLIYQFRVTPEKTVSIPFASAAVYEIFGYTQAEVKQDASPILARIHQKDQTRFYDSIQVSSQQLTPWQCEFRYHHPDGFQRTIFANSSPEREEDGSIIWTGYLQDITEQKKLSEIALMSNVALSPKLNSVPDFLFEATLEGVCTFVHSVSPNLAAPSEGFVGQHIREMLPENATSIVMDAIKEANTQARAQGKRFVIDLATSKNWFEVSVVKHHDPEDIKFIVLLRDVSDQKNIEDKLLANAIAFKSISQGIVVTDIQQRVLAVNDAFTVITGYTVEDLRGQNLRVKQGKDSNPETIAAMREAIQQNKPFEGEILNYRKDGTPFWNALSITPVYDERKKLINYLGVVQDVTERKRAEQQARVDAVAFQSLSEAIMVTDHKRMIISVNQAFVDLTGFPSEFVIGQKSRFFSGLNHPDTIAAIRKTYQEYIPFNGEVLSYKSDGTTFWNELSIRPVFDVNGRVTNFVGVIRDVTERKALYERIERANQVLLTVINATPSKIFWKDIHSNYLGCNLAFAKDIGLDDPVDILGKNDLEIASPAYAEQYHKDDAIVMQTGEAKLFYEEESVDSKGNPRWALKSKVPLKNDRNEVVGLLGVYDDITERKLADQKLKKAQIDLLESKERYVDLYEFAPIGYLTIDAGGMIVEANWKARSVLSIKRKDLGKHRFSEFVDVIDKKRWQSQFATLNAANIGTELVLEVRIAHEAVGSVDVSLNCIVSQEGNTRALRVTMFDITLMKQAEQELRQKEAYQRSLLDNFPFLVWLKDKNSRFLMVNQNFVKAAGKESLDTIIGKTDLDLWEPDLARMYREQDHAVMTNRQSKTVDEIIEVDGKQAWFETYKSPVIVNDKVVGTVGFAKDVSDNKRAVQYEKFKSKILEMVVHEQDLQLILDSVVGGIEQLNNTLFCLIARPDEQGKSLNIVSAQSLPKPFIDAIQGIKIGMGMGSIGSAAFSKRREIIEDVGKHPYWIKNKDLAKKSGINSSWAEPILNSQGNILGVIGVYQHDAIAPNAMDLALIEQAAHIVSLAIERQNTVSQIQLLAYSDVVTGLPNRRFLLEHLPRSISLNIKSKTHGALICLDIDQFKTINESRGHEVGDLFLMEVANRLRTCLSNNDTLVRIGGDEFVILLENLSASVIDSAKHVEKLVNQIVKVFNKPFTLSKQKHHSSACMGITLFGQQKVDAEELLQQADIAMSQAKKSGRGAYCFFDPKMQARITHLVSLEAELRNAIGLNQLQLYYQPQVDHLGQIFGSEALIRWIHPERGMVSPAQFIPLAEESGLIVLMGEWIIDTACAQIKQWQANPKTKDLTLSVNISPLQFRQANFVNQVEASIKKYGIDPMYLRLELTESMLLDNVEETVASMNQLGKFGVQFSLDDFGTGYSSLQYLKRLPLYQLKIDQSFVRDIVSDSHDRTIVRTIIAMAQSMYIGVIAEGVETQEQKELLLTNGCRRYQGYLFGKPMPIDAFNALFD